MPKSFAKVLILAATAALATACGFEHSQTITGPTDVAKSSAMTAAPSQMPMTASPRADGDIPD